MSNEHYVHFLLALKKEKKLKNFLREKNIFLDVIPIKKSFCLSAPVFSDDGYIPHSIRTYIKEHKIDENTYLVIDERSKKVIIRQIISYLDLNSPPRKVLIDFTELAAEYVKILDDVASEDLPFLRKIL